MNRLPAQRSLCENGTLRARAMLYERKTQGMPEVPAYRSNRGFRTASKGYRLHPSNATMWRPQLAPARFRDARLSRYNVLTKGRRGQTSYWGKAGEYGSGGRLRDGRGSIVLAALGWHNQARG